MNILTFPQLGIFQKTLIFKSFLLDIFRIYGTISSESNSERMFDTYEN